ncbi:hypothetical protein RQP46_004532 [Phenoliferia psychrophenolica]
MEDPNIDGVPIEAEPSPAEALASTASVADLDGGDSDMLSLDQGPPPPPINPFTSLESLEIPLETAAIAPPPAAHEHEMSVEAPSTISAAPSFPALSTPKLEDEEETFKVPAMPISVGLNGLPADIEHILSLGANEGDKDEDLGSTTNYEKVVKDMREKAGFAMKEDGPQADKDVELESIEKEMQAGGVERAVKVEEGAEDEQMGVPTVSSAGSATAPVQAAKDDSSSSDSSDSSSSDSDSDAQPSRPTPASSEATPAPSADGARAPRTRNRKRPQKKANNNNDSDLSDDDVNGSGPVGSAPKTEHEVAMPEIALPSMSRLPDDVEIAVVGKIESVIETVVVVRASTAGDWRVLDEGTVCCWDDKTVVGAIFETFGSVQQPFYSLRFPATAVPDPAVFTVGRSIHYAPKMASFVFTRDIRGIKGSDASNIWDEEVAAAEMEWSDDEAEQEYKRSVKAERRSRTASATPGPSSRQNSRAPSAAPSNLPPRPPPSALPYDDAYTPLQRPRDLHLMGDAPPPAAEGRRMFERDTGRNTRGGGAEVEFEFSDDESEGGPAPSFEMSQGQNGRGGRGGARGRGEGRGRGRGGNDAGSGRGGRGRGRADDAGRDRGGGRGRGDQRNGSGSEPRTVAALPRSAPRPAGLPAKPDFIPDMPDGGSDPFVATAGPMRSPPIAGPSASAPPSASFPPITFGANTPPPFYGAGPPQPFNPTFGGQQPQRPLPSSTYSPFNPAMGAGPPANFSPLFPQAYPNQPQQQHQQQQQQPYGGGYQQGYPQQPPQFGAPPPQFGAPNAVSGGHFNPRFFAQQQGGAPYGQPNFGGQGAYPPHGFQGQQPFGGQGGPGGQPQWGFGGVPQGPGMGRPGPGPPAPDGGAGGPPPGWPANGGR